MVGAACGHTPSAQRCLFFLSKGVGSRARRDWLPHHIAKSFYNPSMNTPERTSAAAFPRYLVAEVVADSASLQWPGLFARHLRLPRVVDRLLVPATPEPHISYNLRGTAQFRERDVGGAWITSGDSWRRSCSSRARASRMKCDSNRRRERNSKLLPSTSRSSLSSLRSKAKYPGRADHVEVADYFGSDEILRHISLTCASMLAARIPGKSPCIAALTQLFAAHLVEKYTEPAAQARGYSGGLPIRQLRKVEDYVLSISRKKSAIETLAELAELSPFHFSRVFKETTGMTPLAVRDSRADHPRPADSFAKPPAA